MKNIYFLFIMMLFIIYAPTKAQEDKNLYLVALAGGGGERLWPLSKSNMPKQFLSINGKQSMLEDTLDRLEYVDPHAFIWAVTSREIAKKVHQICGKRFDNILIEPERRDTAPAILFSCLKIAEQDPTAIVAFLPTDHYIPEKKRFAEFMKKALKHAANSQDITLLGVTPTYPATAYGYICYTSEALKDGIAPLKGFYEKPSLEQAKEYIAQGNTLWNAGIFCGKVQSFLDAYKEFVPEMYETMLKVFAGTKNYDENMKISVDYAVMEKIPYRAVVPADIIWSDVGDLKNFLSFQEHNDENIISIDSQNNFIHCKKLIALVGVKNLCIVETDNEILIVPNDKVQLVRHLVEFLKSDNKLHAFT